MADENNDDGDNTTKNCFGCEDERTLWTRIWQGTAGASIAVNIVSMAIEGPTVAIIAGIIACIIAPVVIYLQFQLQDTDTLRTVQNDIRREVNRLNTENNKLKAEVTQLGVQVGRLKEEEKKLDEITKTQGSNVETFVELVKENQTTLDSIKVSLKNELTQTLVSACIESDADFSGHFSDSEIRFLELRLKNLPGIIVNHELLTKKVHNSDRKLESILNLLNDLDSDDIPDSERIFRFDDKHLTKKQ